MKINKKILGIIFIAAVILMLIINLVFFAKGDKKVVEVVKEETKQVVQKETKKDPLEETKKATKNLYRSKITPVGKGEEYPKNQAGVLKRQLLDLAEKGDYGKLLQKVNSLTESNKFSEGENLDIAGIIYDAGIIADIFGKETNELKYGETVASSKTPEMLIISTLFSDNFARRPVIEDITSLAPVGFESVDFGERRTFHNPKEAADEPLFASRNVVDEIFVTEDNVLEVFAFNITIAKLDGGLPLTAYVSEDLYGNIKFYGMYAPDDFKTYEQKLEWWMEQDIFYENAEKQQEKNYEENGKNGVITNEQIDMLFESGY